MGRKTRRQHGTPEAHGPAQAQEARVALAEAGQGHEADGREEAEDALTFQRTASALKRLVTEPGETWVLETDQPADVSMEALKVWSQTRGVVLLVFGPGERFGVLHTQPGDTVILYSTHPEQLNAEVLSAWAQSRGLQLAVLPPDAHVQHLDDATLDQVGLQRKQRLLVLPSAAGVPADLKGNGA